jgi:hypothetical protein
VKHYVIMAEEEEDSNSVYTGFLKVKSKAQVISFYFLDLLNTFPRLNSTTTMMMDDGRMMDYIYFSTEKHRKQNAYVHTEATKKPVGGWHVVGMSVAFTPNTTRKVRWEFNETLSMCVLPCSPSCPALPCPCMPHLALPFMPCLADPCPWPALALPFFCPTLPCLVLPYFALP